MPFLKLLQFQSPIPERFSVTSLWWVYCVLNTKWRECTHTHAHARTGTHIWVCMASASSMKSNISVNLETVGGWNPSSTAFPPRWALMESYEDAGAGRFPGSILFSVYLQYCVKLPRSYDATCFMPKPYGGILTPPKHRWTGTWTFCTFVVVKIFIIAIKKKLFSRFQFP